MKKPNVVQLDNHYIQDEHAKRYRLEEETRRRNRFMGWTLVCMMLLLILPTYNLVSNYLLLRERQGEIKHLEKDYDVLVRETEAQKLLAKQLKDDTFVGKYARAKYYYSQTGEIIYPVADLLPK